MSTIRIATEYLRAEQQRVVLLAADFASFSTLPECHLTSAPEVAAAFRDFDGKWDQRRGELAAGLHDIADALGIIRSTFEKVDADLAAQLDAPPTAPSPEY